MAQDIMSDPHPNVRDMREFLTYNGEYKICPLCQSHICLFLINFTDKLIMCENQYCDFPFGYEKPKILKPGDKLDNGYDISIGIHRKPPSARESDNATNVNKQSAELPRKKQKKINTKPDNEERMKKNIEDINKMNVELLLLNQAPDQLELQEEGTHSIKNEKWIKRLRNLQEKSGVQLLKPEEMGMLRKEEPAIGLGELTIDIGSTNASDVPLIRIEIHKNNQDKNNL